MKVKIEFDIDNAAYTLGEDEIHNYEAVADTIDRVAAYIRRGRLSGNVYDINGNTAGSYSIK